MRIHQYNMRILTFALILAMLVSWLPSTVHAEESISMDITQITAPAAKAIIVNYDQYVSNVNANLGLPETVTVTLADGTTADVAVTWDTSSLDVNTLGTYSLPGTITLPEGATNSQNLTVTQQIIIREYTNLLSNPSFESGTTGWHFRANTTQVTSPVKDGTYAAKIDGDPNISSWQAQISYDKWGFGLSSVRFICGTQQIHKDLEAKISKFVGMDDAILYSSCFDANGGLFETLLSKEDAVISDELNHASIIDGVRLCKAMRYRYKNNNMEDLRAQLEAARAAGAKKILIATDGVFSMDGYIANLQGICDLADEFDALVMVDDSHAVGFMGDHGRGTPEFCGVMDRVDIITGTFGKALGGASGGYTAARQPIVDLLRQRSRPYLFSNTVAPAVCAATIRTIELLEESTALRDKVHENARYFRSEMEKLGFDLLPGEHPIVPVMLYDPKVAHEFAKRMLDKGVYVVAFCYPVVPKGKDRIRTQISAGHTKEDIDFAVKAFGEVKKEMGL